MNTSQAYIACRARLEHHSHCSVSNHGRIGIYATRPYWPVKWTLAAGEFAIVQAWPITALPEPGSDLPPEWKLAPGAYIAMRSNIVELMAEPLSPLFGTLGVQAANPGQVTASARVLNGPEDFAQMQTGDVLVVAITTPWPGHLCSPVRPPSLQMQADHSVTVRLWPENMAFRPRWVRVVPPGISTAGRSSWWMAVRGQSFSALG